MYGGITNSTTRVKAVLPEDVETAIADVVDAKFGTPPPPRTRETLEGWCT